MNLDKWKSQIARGTLEYCILLMLQAKTCYGYEILQKLSGYPVIASTESTVYPLLRRLQKEGFLQSSWQDSTEGLPPRKYYSLTPEGSAYLQALDEEWQNLLSAVSGLKNPGFETDNAKNTGHTGTELPEKNHGKETGEKEHGDRKR